MNTLTASLQSSKTLPNECRLYDTKQFDGEAWVMLAQLAGAVEYTDGTSAEG